MVVLDVVGDSDVEFLDRGPGPGVERFSLQLTSGQLDESNVIAIPNGSYARPESVGTRIRSECLRCELCGPRKDEVRGVCQFSCR